MRIAGFALAALLGASTAAASMRPQEEGRDPADLGDATEAVGALLGSLMGSADVTGAELQQEVAEVGGIPFQRDVPVAFMSHEGLVRYLGELLDSEYPADRADADRRLLEAFDLLAPGTDLRALRFRLLEENVVGFYDERPGRRQLYAVSEERTFTPMNQIVLAHELRHALQDQYEPLHWQVPEDVGDFDDRRLAWVSLLEGDATLVMERVVLARMGRRGLEAQAEGLEQPLFRHRACGAGRPSRGATGASGSPRDALSGGARPRPRHP